MQKIGERCDEDAMSEIAGRAVNFRLCFDGAHRGDGRSAGGMALFVYCRGQRLLLHRAGEQFGILASSFTAELLALEWSLERYLSIMNCINNTKRLRVN